MISIVTVLVCGFLEAAVFGVPAVLTMALHLGYSNFAGGKSIYRRITGRLFSRADCSIARDSADNNDVPVVTFDYVTDGESGFSD